MTPDFRTRAPRYRPWLDMAGETFGRADGEQEDAMLVAAAASMEAGRQHLNDALPVVAMEAFTNEGHLDFAPG